jgi:tight adherence protein C
MRWALAIGYTSAAALLLTGLAARRDPRVVRMLGIRTARSRMVVTTGRRIRAPRSRSRIAGHLDTDAPPDAVDAVLGWKVVAAAIGALAGPLLTSGWLMVPTAGLLASTGWRLPDFLLARRTRSRRERAEAAIPELLDVVAVSVTAGLTPRLALDRAGGAIRGPLGDEMRAAGRAVQLGEPWPATLRRTAERLGLRDLGRLASTLERSTRLGSPVAERLRLLAREVRSERRAREEERARRAPVTMLFPLVFLILPAFVLAAVVPTILVATRGIR